MFRKLTKLDLILDVTPCFKLLFKINIFVNYFEKSVYFQKLIYEI